MRFQAGKHGVGDERSWKTGFSREGPGLKTQLDDLRKKYTGKIVMSPFNTIKDETTKESEDFHKMDPTEKAKMLKDAATVKVIN